MRRKFQTVSLTAPPGILHERTLRHAYILDGAWRRAASDGCEQALIERSIERREYTHLSLDELLRPFATLDHLAQKCRASSPNHRAEAQSACKAMIQTRSEHTRKSVQRFKHSWLTLDNPRKGPGHRLIAIVTNGLDTGLHVVNGVERTPCEQRTRHHRGLYATLPCDAHISCDTRTLYNPADQQHT